MIEGHPGIYLQHSAGMRCSCGGKEVRLARYTELETLVARAFALDLAPVNERVLCDRCGEPVPSVIEALNGYVVCPECWEVWCGEGTGSRGHPEPDRQGSGQ